MILKNDHFALANFEGSIDFLLCLIHKEEINVYDIPIQELIQQFINKLQQAEERFEKGAEFIGMASYLVWLKSKTLLPFQETSTDQENNFEDPHFEMIHHLIDYCRFKQAAKHLAFIYEKQQTYYCRGLESVEWKKPLKIDVISLQELFQLFKKMINRTQIRAPIEDEEWRVSDKINVIINLIKERTSFPITLLISIRQTRLEIIATFLAILELIKRGVLRLVADNSGNVLIFAKKDSCHA